jgi:hypothetical protein
VLEGGAAIGQDSCECQAQCVCQQGDGFHDFWEPTFLPLTTDGRAAEWTVNDVLVGSLFVIGIILATYEQAVTEGLPGARSDGGVGSWFKTTF